MNDQLLQFCNETELLASARRQGLGRLRRGLPREILEKLVAGEIGLAAEHVASTTESRSILEKGIAQQYNRLRSQLPGCDGHCTTYNCTEGRHAACFGVNEDAL